MSVYGHAYRSTETDDGGFTSLGMPPCEMFTAVKCLSDDSPARCRLPVDDYNIERGSDVSLPAVVHLRDPDTRGAPPLSDGDPTPTPLLEAVMRWVIRGVRVGGPYAKLVLLHIVSEQVQGQAPVPRNVIADQTQKEMSTRTRNRVLREMAALPGVTEGPGGFLVDIPWEWLLRGDWYVPLGVIHGASALVPDLPATDVEQLAAVLKATRHDGRSPVDGVPRRTRRDKQPPLDPPHSRPLVITPRHRKVHALAERDGWKCYMCGVPLIDVCADTDVLYDAAGGRYVHMGQAHRLPHVEHRVPRALRGSEEPVNKGLACTPCNLRKGAA